MRHLNSFRAVRFKMMNLKELWINNKQTYPLLCKPPSSASKWNWDTGSRKPTTWQPNIRQSGRFYCWLFIYSKLYSTLEFVIKVSSSSWVRFHWTSSKVLFGSAACSLNQWMCIVLRNPPLWYWTSALCYVYWVDLRIK